MLYPALHTAINYFGHQLVCCFILHYKSLQKGASKGKMLSKQKKITCFPTLPSSMVFSPDDLFDSFFLTGFLRGNPGTPGPIPWTHGTVDGSEIVHLLRLVVSPIICRVSAPSQVVTVAGFLNHQQYGMYGSHNNWGCWRNHLTYLRKMTFGSLRLLKTSQPIVDFVVALCTLYQRPCHLVSKKTRKVAQLESSSKR